MGQPLSMDLRRRPGPDRRTIPGPISRSIRWWKRNVTAIEQILRAANAMAGESMSVRGVPITKELYHLILFTTHSFVRPIISELYALKHKDVTVADDPKRLLLTIRNGKTGYRVTNTMPLAVGVYRHMKRRHPDA